MLSDMIVSINYRWVFSLTMLSFLVWEEVGLVVKGFDVAAFADAWTKQAGFPVVHVEKLGNHTYHLTQERYLVKGLEKGKRNNQIWLILQQV